MSSHYLVVDNDDEIFGVFDTESEMLDTLAKYLEQEALDIGLTAAQILNDITVYNVGDGIQEHSYVPIYIRETNIVLSTENNQ